MQLKNFLLKVIFSVCLSVHQGGGGRGGTTLASGSMSLTGGGGGTPCLWSQVLSWGGGGRSVEGVGRPQSDDPRLDPLARIRTGVPPPPPQTAHGTDRTCRGWYASFKILVLFKFTLSIDTDTGYLPFFLNLNIPTPP